MTDEEKTFHLKELRDEYANLAKMQSVAYTTAFDAITESNKKYDSDYSLQTYAHEAALVVLKSFSPTSTDMKDGTYE